MKDLSDEDLILASAKGDKTCFAELTRRYSRRFFALTYRFFYTEQLANEVTQEIMLKIWLNAEKWDRSKGSAFSWMYKIAQNKCIDEKRKIKNVEFSGLEEDYMMPDSTPNAEQKLRVKQEASVVKKEMEHLPEKQKTAISLFYFDELTMGEISDIMEINKKAVENLLVRARKTLRERLA